MSIQTPARKWAGRSLLLTRSLGQMARGTVTVQPPADSPKLTGEEVRDFATSLNRYISTRRADLERDIKIDLTVGSSSQEISGFLTGCSVTTSAANAATEFNLHFLETNLPLNSISLGCYRIPQSSSDSSTANKGVELPYYGIFNDIQGDLGNRIGQIYRRAQERHVTLADDPFDEVMGRQRELNTKLEFAFRNVLLRSNWNLPWLEPEWLARKSMSAQINGFLAQTLLGANTLWQALLHIARVFHLEYRGDPDGVFGAGGFGYVDPTERVTHALERDPVSQVSFQVGSSMELPLSQVIVVPYRKPSDKGSDSSTLNRGAQREKHRPAAVFPDRPNPEVGRTLILQAPSYMTVPVPTSADKKRPRKEAVDDETVEESADIYTETFAEDNQASLEFSKGPLRAWARAAYVRESTRHLSAAITKPLELGNIVLGARASVGGGTNGIIQSATTQVQISQNSGQASVNFVCTNLTNV